MGLASDRTVYSSKRNRPLLLYGRLLDDSRPSHGLTATNPDYFLFVDHSLTAGSISGIVSSLGGTPLSLTGGKSFTIVALWQSARNHSSVAEPLDRARLPSARESQEAEDDRLGL